MKYYNVFVLRGGVLAKKTFIAQSKEEAMRMGKRNFERKFGVKLMDCEVMALELPEEAVE